MTGPVDADHDVERDLSALEEYPVLCAYNANVDAIVRVDDALADVLGPPAGDGTPARLDSLGELSTALARTMESGHGDERPMSDDLAATLLERVEPDEQGLGGQAGLMSNVLSVLGAAPVIWTYMPSARQKATFQRPEAVRFPVREGDDVRLVPLTEAPESDSTKVNFIFEFREGTEFHGARAAASTRFIAAMRPERFDLDLGDLDGVVDRLAERVNGALLSGYHSLRRTDEDGTAFAEGIERGRRTLRRLTAASDVEVQVEYGVTHYDDLRRLIRERIVPETDVVGLDGRELDLLVEDLGLDAPAGGSPAVRRYEAMRAVREALPVRAVRLHATDYFLAVMEGYHDPEHVRRGFEFAAVVAAAKAAGGRLSTSDDVRRGLAHPPAADGVDTVADLAAHVGAEPTAAGSLATEGVVAVPNRVVPDPRGTVGIGDVVAASSFALENALADGWDRRDGPADADGADG
jgi:ADP-dependent phosphofructokinase/glucokinase